MYVIPIYVHCIIHTRIIYVYAQYVSLGKNKNFEFLLWRSCDTLQLAMAIYSVRTRVCMYPRPVDHLIIMHAAAVLSSV